MPKSRIVAVAAAIVVAAAPALAQKAKNTLRVGFYDPIRVSTSSTTPRARPPSPRARCSTR